MDKTREWATRYAGRDTDGGWEIKVGGKWLVTLPYDAPDISARMVDTLNEAVSPLLARVELLDRMREWIRTSPSQVACNEFIDAYASLSKMPE